MKYFKKYEIIAGFFICSIVVFFIHFTIYQPILQYRLFIVSEDWPFLVLYRSLYPNPLARLIEVWTTVGLHTTAQIYHIGILSDFLKLDYSNYQVINVVLKVAATLSFFPLILVLFKNYKLAFLAPILFGISSATAGAFLWIVKGSEYIGIAFLNIFLITYYFVILKKSRWLLLLSSILFLAAYLMAPPRMFPMLLLVPLIEVYWSLRLRNLKNLKFSIMRILIYILPIILISLPAPIAPGFAFTTQPFVLLRYILSGNWHNLIDPFASIGWTLVTNDFWKFFGKLEMETFKNFGTFLIFLLKGPILIFGALSLAISLVLSKEPAKFFILVFGLNILSEILIFIIASNHLYIPTELVMPYSPGHFLATKYPSLVGIYIFIVAFASFLEWRQKRDNNLLKAIWAGPIFSVVFLWPTWIVMGPLVNDYSSVHWYFGIPAMGTTLFMAAILISVYEKFKHRNLSKSFALLGILVIIFIFYQNHGVAIAKQYLGINPQKLSLKDQQLIHQQLISKLGQSAQKGNLLVYFDIIEDALNLRRTPEYYREALVLSTTNFGYWVHFRRSGTGVINDGCIAGTIDKKKLKSAIQIKNDKLGFEYQGVCVDKNATAGNQAKKIMAFFGLNNFYAFRIENGEFIDIRNETLKELGI